MVPGTVDDVPVNVRNSVEPLIDDAFIGSLNTTTIVVDGLTLGARCGGETDTTLGGVKSGADAVEKVDIAPALRGFPERSEAAVVTEIV